LPDEIECEKCFQLDLDIYTEICCGCGDCASNAEHAASKIDACPCEASSPDWEADWLAEHRDCAEDSDCGCKGFMSRD